LLKFSSSGTAEYEGGPEYRGGPLDAIFVVSLVNSLECDDKNVVRGRKVLLVYAMLNAHKTSNI
jgi:hypothetical protein